MAFWSVKQDGSGDFLTIVAALTAAGPGDTIEVQDNGSYTGNHIIWQTNLTLRAAVGNTPTMVSSTFGFCVRVNGAITGVLIQRMAMSLLAIGGNAVQVLANGRVELDSCNISTGAANAKGVWTQGGTGPQLIHDCQFSGFDRAIEQNCHDMRIDRCTFTSCAYGIYAYRCHGWVKRCKFSGQYFYFAADPGAPPSYNAFEAANNLAVCAADGIIFEQSSSPILAYPHTYNNTLIGDGVGADNGIRFGLGLDDAASIVRDNIIVGFGGTGLLGSGAGLVTHDHDDIWSCGTGWGGGLAAGPTDLTTDPEISNPATGEIGSGSPCRNAGVDTGVGEDIRGVTRPQGAAYDIGCWEINAPPPTVVSTARARPFEWVGWSLDGHLMPEDLP